MESLVFNSNDAVKFTLGTYMLPTNRRSVSRSQMCRCVGNNHELIRVS